MRILIATPLYPPDIAEPAPYVKELANRLKQSDAVTVLAYNHIPEEVPGVRIVTVPKRLPLFFRLTHFTYTLFQEVRKADVICIQNGPSIELPYTLISYITNTPVILRIGDERAFFHAISQRGRRWLLTATLSRVQKIMVHQKKISSSALLEKFSKKTICSEGPHTRPEILPFSAYPEDAFQAYESSWKQHLTDLRNACVTLTS